MVEPAARVSYDDYLALEATSEEKHEWIDGVVYAMAGGTYEHGRLAASFTGELRTALRGKPCNVLSADVRVRIEATRRTTYPDLSVVCGKPEHAANDRHAITNPIVLVEVLSESTEASDRGDEWAHYQHLASLREYVLVSQTEPRIEVYSRSGSAWTYVAYSAGSTVELGSLGVAIALDAVYADPAALA